MPPPSPSSSPAAWLQHQLQQHAPLLLSAPVCVALAAVLLSSLLFYIINRRMQGSSSSSQQQQRRGKGLPKSVARAAYESLRSRELAWLRGLPPQAQAALMPGGHGGRGGKGPAASSFPAHALLHSGEIAMVLVGIKPCCVVADRGGLSYAAAFAEEVVR
jgi:hypothetical protein